MRRSLHALFLLLTLLMCASAHTAARADDGIFPAARVAKSAIDFDGKGFLLNGRREFIASGSMHYSRVPRGLWRDRLLRIKRAGFNTVETYAFWNFHEMQEGKWDFAGDKDFNAYLKLIKELGMYAIVRIGPYVCAEWDSGGYPVWLRFKPGVRVRVPNAEFETAVDKWYDKIMPIVAANQIHRGGAVILVQLENEHPQGWGREMPNAYFTHLRDKALSLGLEVPWFFSGLHHGHDPAGNQPWSSENRENPWMTTEFWPGWYDIYGPLSARDTQTYVRGLWKILAYGGNGYNFYMLHGGTDFDTWNDNEVASNYDYGAAVGQAGDLRPIYYQFKRGSLFARAFADVLENSVNSTDKYQDIVTEKSLKVTARTSPAGTILFLDNKSDGFPTTDIKAADGHAYVSGIYRLELKPNQIAPVVLDYKLLPNVTLECGTHIYNVVRQGDTVTIVVDGWPVAPEITTGSPDFAVLHFRTGGEKAIYTKRPQLDFPLTGPAEPLSSDHPTVILPMQRDRSTECAFTVGKSTVRVLALDSSAADHTYFVSLGGKEYIVGGVDYVGDVTANKGGLTIQAEQASLRQANVIGSPVSLAQTFVYDPDGMRRQLTVGAGKAELPEPEPPALSAWQMRRGDAQASPAYNAANWKSGDTPLPMGADGDASAYAWYRANARVDKADTLNLQFHAANDWIAVWVNGQRVGADVLKPHSSNTPVPRTVSVPLQAGDNTIAVLAAHYGRDKLFNHLGSIDTYDPKGLSGPVTLSKGAPVQQEVTAWTWRAAPGMRAATIPARLGEDFSVTGADWQPLAGPDQDVFNKQRGFAWFTTTLAPALGPRHRLHFENVDDNATVYLNGQKIGAHQGWGQPFDVDIPAGAWQASRPNRLVVLVENTENTGGIQGATQLQTPNPENEREVRGWKMRGGISDFEKGAVWQPLGDRSHQTGVPTFFRADFTANPPSAPGATPAARPILRVTLDGLTRGFLWLNGHNLGRYPEKVPIKSLYLPETWLKKGRNTLTVFDEEGNTPRYVHLVVEQAASRTTAEYAAK